MFAAAFLLAILLRLRLIVALTHVHQASLPSWDQALNAFADQIEWTTRDMEEEIVVLTIAGGSIYKPRWPELLVHYKKRAGLPFAVVAMDNVTTEYFQGQGVPSMYFDLERFGQKPHKQPKNWPSREAVMRGKYEVTSVLLDRGITVVMSELDVYWKRNPLVLLEELPGKDFLVTQHKYDRGGEVNVGFFIAKPSPSARRTFANVRTWLNSDLRGETACGGCFDQVLLDYAIRCTKRAKLLSKCHFPQLESEIICSPTTPEADRLNWSHIPWERLPHPPLHHRYDSADDEEMEEYRKVLETAVGTHLWTGFAQPYYQMKYAYDHGFWADDAPPILNARRKKPELLLEGQEAAVDGGEERCGCDDLFD